MVCGGGHADVLQPGVHPSVLFIPTVPAYTRLRKPECLALWGLRGRAGRFYHDASGLGRVAVCFLYSFHPTPPPPPQISVL
jgi:hypothetical protein